MCPTSARQRSTEPAEALGRPRLMLGRACWCDTGNSLVFGQAVAARGGSGIGSEPVQVCPPHWQRARPAARKRGKSMCTPAG